MASDTLKVNLGCGGVVAEGWVNIDRGDQGQQFVIDMRNGLPFKDGEVDYAVAHHVLDLFTPPELADFLIECHRILRPGGGFRVSVADIPRAIAAAECGDLDWFWMVEHGSTILEKLSWYVTCGGARQTFLTETLIEDALRAAGFHIDLWSRADKEIRELDSRPDESIFIDGVA